MKTNNEQHTYAELEQLLTSLGFESKRVKGSHVYFDEPVSGAGVAVKDYDPHELVEPAKLIAVQGTLDGFGLLEKDEFERRLHRMCAVDAR